MRGRWFLVLFVVAIAAVMLVLAAMRGVTVTVENAGPDPLQDLVVVVRGAEYPVGDLAVDASVDVKVEPVDESEVTLRWMRADGRGGNGRVRDAKILPGYSGTVRAKVIDNVVKETEVDVSPGFW